ncbi:DUF1559 family PulG-like putative transporter [Lignipirellula cremea]|uniref:DUF1559 domain-containing protein n=1 Tax=Lignipirellula cremea TaxID=2528010 RepID=A0A518E4R4_9BACT|nr:DUF1559 domain-containing protein [Lignipirellula cremea]QDU99077.1 hypothetical protein Pla8534_69880 [Lignipirellula cremea]
MASPASSPARGNVALVLAALLLLGSVGLPLLVNAREAARSSRCEERLGKLARGCRAYAAVHQETLPSNRRQPFVGWNTLILPHVEQQEMYDQYDLREDWWTGKNRTLGSKQVDDFLCPAAPHPQRRVDLLDPDGQAFQAAATDYVASAGAYLFRNQVEQLYRGAMASPGRRYEGSGVTAGHAVKLSEITDGQANSLLIVEMADKPNSWRAGKLHEDRSQNADPQPLVEGYSIGQWVAPNWNHLRSYSADGATPFGPCSVNCSNSGSLYGFHQGYANAAFVDGSVRKIRAGLEEEVLVALVSIADRELLSAADYEAE